MINFKELISIILPAIAIKLLRDNFHLIITPAQGALN